MALFMLGNGSPQWQVRNFQFIQNSVADINLVQTTEYLAYYLLTNYASSTEIKGFVDKYDFYIFPVVNPDGNNITSFVKQQV